MKVFIITAIPIVVAILLFQASRTRAAEQQRYKEVFESVFANSSTKPKYEQEYSYGYPAFTLTFASKAELDEAVSGKITDLFSQRIGEVCRNTGSKKHPFDAERAIWLTYEGELETMTANARSLGDD